MITSRKYHAFTLVELVVSLAITAVIAFFVFSFTSSLAEIWRTTEGGVDTELDVQIALDRISMDLESAVFRELWNPGDEESGPEPVAMFAVSTVSKTDLLPQNTSRFGRWVGVADIGRPDDWDFNPSKHQYGWGGSWLRFFCAAPSFNAVGYHLARRDAFDNSSVRRYLLHRSVVEQNETWLGGYDIDKGTYGKGEIPNRTTDVLANPWLESVILEDVVDFGVRLYIYDNDFDGTMDAPAGLRLIYPADDAGSLSEDVNEHVAYSFNVADDYSVRYPDVIEVYLRVLDDVGAALLIKSEEEEVDRYEEIVEKHSRLYRRIVRLPGRVSKGYSL